MMWHLSTHLGMNHRDLKPSNFLIVEHGHPVHKIITIGNEIIELSSSFSLTLIDFGFSCIGTMDTKKSVISLSSVYSTLDPCPKDGRDMYLFLGLFYIDFHEILTADLKQLFERWLEVSSSTNLCHFIRKNPDKNVAKKWLYFIAGNEAIKEYQSCPIRIIHDLHQHV
jgi:serine/threonine protein kinase